MDWNETYRSGDYKRHWDSSYPSPELAGLVSTIGNISTWKIMDVGCGTGEDAIFLSSYAKQVYGLDVSSLAIEIAKKKSLKKGVGAMFVTGSVFSTPFDNDYFDLITDRGCLHNIGLEDWPKYETEVYRVMRIGGILFLRGARRIKAYGENFIFLEPETLKKVFSTDKWEIKGPYEVTLYSDARDGTLLSNLFVLRKLDRQ